MTGKMLIIDDRTGRTIGPDTRYFQVQASNPDGTRSYRDVSSMAGVLDEVRAQLRRADLSSTNQRLTVEIQERRTDPGRTPEVTEDDTTSNSVAFGPVKAPDDSPFGPIQKWPLPRPITFKAFRPGSTAPAGEELDALKVRAEKRRTKYIATLAEMCGCNDPTLHEGAVFKP